MSELKLIESIQQSAERAADAGYSVECNPWLEHVSPGKYSQWRHHFFARQDAIERAKKVEAAC